MKNKLTWNEIALIIQRMPQELRNEVANVQFYCANFPCKVEVSHPGFPCISCAMTEHDLSQNGELDE